MTEAPRSGSTREVQKLRQALREVVKLADAPWSPEGEHLRLRAIRSVATNVLPARRTEEDWPLGRCMECDAHHNRVREAIGNESGGGFPMCEEHLWTEHTPSGSTTLAPELSAEDVRVLRIFPPHSAAGLRHHTLRERIATANTPLPWLTVMGLRHLGYVARYNGWWKRTAAGDTYLHHLDAPPAPQETLA
jgi:hypothetical protein